MHECTGYALSRVLVLEESSQGSFLLSAMGTATSKKTEALHKGIVQESIGLLWIRLIATTQRFRPHATLSRKATSCACAHSSSPVLQSSNPFQTPIHSTEFILSAKPVFAVFDCRYNSLRCLYLQIGPFSCRQRQTDKAITYSLHMCAE